MSDTISRALNDLLSHVAEAPTKKEKLLILDAARFLLSETEDSPNPMDEKTLLVMRGFGKKIDAIKALRHCIAGMSLKDAKFYVENTMNGPLVICHKDHNLATVLRDILSRATAEMEFISLNELAKYPNAVSLKKEGFQPVLREG